MFRFAKLTIYETCDTMPLYNFEQYLKTHDLKWFTKQHKPDKRLHDVMTNFFGEYLKLTENNTVVSRFGKLHKILKLQTKYYDMMVLLTACFNYPSDAPIDTFKRLIEQIQGWGYKIVGQEVDGIFSQLEKIYNRVQSIKTQIAMLQNDFDKSDEKEAVTMEKQRLNVERILELKHKIDPKETTVLEWIEMQKSAKEENDNRKKAMKK